MWWELCFGCSWSCDCFRWFGDGWIVGIVIKSVVCLWLVVIIFVLLLGFRVVFGWVSSMVKIVKFNVSGYFSLCLFIRRFILKIGFGYGGWVGVCDYYRWFGYRENVYFGVYYCSV